MKKQNKGIMIKYKQSVAKKSLTAGITLVALVITIIILLILAGITINLTIGENGIIQKALLAKENTIRASEEEANALNKLWGELEGKVEDTEKGDLENGPDEPTPEDTNSNGVDLLWTNPEIKAQETFTVECDLTKYDKIIILFKGYYGDLFGDQRYIYCYDVGTSLTGSRYGWYADFIGQSNGGVRREITFTDENITMYAPEEHNWYAYNIPLKVWGMKTNVDMFSWE